MRPLLRPLLALLLLFSSAAPAADEAQLAARRKLADKDVRFTSKDFFWNVRTDEVKNMCGTAARLEALIGPLAIPPLEDTLRWMLED